MESEVIGAYQYQSNQNQDELHDLVCHYAPLVKRIAEQIKWNIPQGIELDDLIQSGLIGLLEAKNTYAPEHQTAFKTYATLKIRYAIFETLRKHTGITRELSQSIKQISAATETLHRAQEEITTQKVTELLGLSHHEYACITESISMLKAKSLDGSMDDECIQANTNDPFFNTASDQIRSILKEVLQDLPRREQLILALYYNEFLSFKEIGGLIDLTEARVSQLHAQLLSKLKTRLQHVKNYSTDLI